MVKNNNRLIGASSVLSATLSAVLSSAFISAWVVALLVSCGQHKAEERSWYAPLSTMMSQNEKVLQANPDSMMQLISRFKGDGNQELIGQWKNLLMAKCYFMKGDDAQCVERIKQAWTYARQHEGEAAASKISSYADNLYGVLMLNTGKRPEAFRHFVSAYHALMPLADHDDAIDICINAADASRQMGKLADASSWYRRANFLADSLRIEKTQNSILAGLGQVYNDMKNYRIAHYYFAKAERLYPPQNDKDSYFFYNSWGNVYSSEGKSAEALRCFLKAQRATFHLSQPVMTAVVDANLGQTYMELNRLDSAAKYLDRTSAFFLAKPDMQSDIQFYVDGLNASLALKKGELVKARLILDKPYILSSMSPNYLYLYHKSLSALYEKTGDYAKALRYEKLMSQYDDSLRNVTMLSNVSDNELRFKQDTAIIRRDIKLEAAKASARSGRIIAVLVIGMLCLLILALAAWYRYKSLRNKQQHHEEMRRMQALKMENVRNRFSPHFVFNVLNVFISSIPKDVNVKPLRLLIQVLRSNLITCDKVAVPLDEELQMVTNYSYLRHETNPLLPVPVFEVGDEVERSMLLPSMIIQIPVENALKHAFVDGDMQGRKPELKVTIRMEGDYLHVRVKDNGCGFVKGETRKRNAAVSTGTGLRILHSTIDMLNAGNSRKITFDVQSVRVEHHSNPASLDSVVGTRVDIKVPKSYDYHV